MYILVQKKDLNASRPWKAYTIGALGGVPYETEIDGVIFGVQPFLSYKHLINALSADIDILKHIGETKNGAPQVKELKEHIRCIYPLMGLSLSSSAKGYSAMQQLCYHSDLVDLFVYNLYGNLEDTYERVATSLDDEGKPIGFEIVDKGQLIQDVRRHSYSYYLENEHSRHINKLLKDEYSKKHPKDPNPRPCLFDQREHLYGKYYRSYHIHRTLVENTKGRNADSIFDELDSDIDISPAIINKLVTERSHSPEDPWANEKLIPVYRSWKSRTGDKKQYVHGSTKHLRRKGKGMYVQADTTNSANYIEEEITYEDIMEENNA